MSVAMSAKTSANSTSYFNCCTISCPNCCTVSYLNCCPCYPIAAAVTTAAAATTVATAATHIYTA